MPGITLLASINPTRNTVAGSIGITADSELIPQAQIGQPVDLALKWWPGAGNLGAEVRWQPAWMSEYAVSEQDQTVFIYDFGAVEGYDDWVGNTVTFDQILLGWGPSWSWAMSSIRLTTTLNGYVAGGVRLERVQEQDSVANPRFPDTGVHTAAVVQGGLGARVGYQAFEEEHHWLNQIRLGIGVDGWQPFPSGETHRGADTGSLFRPGFAWYMTVGSHVMW
jgi:hypothetical protein